MKRRKRRELRCILLVAVQGSLGSAIMPAIKLMAMPPSHCSRNTYGGEGSSIEKEEERELGEERITCLKTVFKMGLSEVREGM